MKNPQYFPDQAALSGVPFHVHTDDGTTPTPDASKVDKTTTINGQALSSNITLAKADIGLPNVDNTADVNKPVSTAQATAINAKLTATKAATQAASIATDVAGIVTDFNALLAKLKTAGIVL